MKMPTRMKSQTDSNVVSSLLVPIQNKSLLVPNVVVAEVVGMQKMDDVEDAPPWLQGFMFWRGERIPVISFEIANSQVSGRHADNSRIAILNAVSGESAYQFFAIIVQGIPRMIRLTETEIREDLQASKGQAEQMAVTTQLGKAIIPNLNFLESLISRV